MKNSVCMFDEREARQACIRAINQFTNSSDISNQDKVDAKKALDLIKTNEVQISSLGGVLCSSLASYLRCLKSVESFIISDTAFRGFDGSNPLLLALNKEIGITLDAKAQFCHDELPKRQSRIDW